MTIADDYPAAVSGRPLWLMTLADLALLLVGYFVLLQATAGSDRRALARGLRQGFGAAAVAAPATPAMPVAAGGMLGFAPGSADVAGQGAGLVAWARDAARDPRVLLTVTGTTDGTAADVDPSTGSAAILAADRARAAATLIAAAVPRRVVITTSPVAGRRAATVTLAFAGEPKEKP